MSTFVKPHFYAHFNDLFMVCFSESDGNHSTEDEASVMDDTPDKPEEAAGSKASIISLSAVPCSTGGQLILNASSGFITASQPLLLSGNSLIPSSGGGVIINGLSLADSEKVTLSPVANSSLILNGAQVVAKPEPQSNSVQQVVSLAPQEVSAMKVKPNSLSAVACSTNTTTMSNPPSILSLAVQPKTEGANAHFIAVPEELIKSDSSQTMSSSSSSLSPSSPTLSPTSLPSLVFPQNSPHQLSLTPMPSTAMAIASSALPPPSQQGEYVVFATSGSQLTPCSTVVNSSHSTPQVFSMPQVVPSIQGVPVSQLVQHSSGSHVSQSPQLVPISPLPASTPQFQSVQQQKDALTALSDGPTTIVSISQFHNTPVPQRVAASGDQTNSMTSKVQAPQVISISSPTRVPVPQVKGTTPAQSVPLSMPQLVPVSSVPTSSTVSFPQVVPTSPSLSSPSAGLPLQILTSAPATAGVTQSPLRVNQLRPVQSVGPPTSGASGVQLLNPGIIHLPSAPQGTQMYRVYPSCLSSCTQKKNQLCSVLY